MSTTEAAEVTDFLQAADMFGRLCARIEEHHWTRPALGEWDVRALVGHTLRAVTTVSTYLSEPEPDAVGCGSAGEYFVAARAVPGADDQAVADRGRRAGRDLGDDPGAVVAREIARARRSLAAVGEGDPVVPTVVGGMRLRDYLPTRTFELLAHSLDLSAATAIPVDPPSRVVESSLRTAVVAAALTGDGVALFRHLLGRPGGAHQPLFG